MFMRKKGYELPMVSILFKATLNNIGEIFVGRKMPTEFKKKKEKLTLFGVGELSASSGPEIQLTSNKSASVEGCKGVVDYYDSLVKLKIQNGTVCFYGHSLVIVSLTDTNAEIKGEIDKVEFNVKG